MTGIGAAHAVESNRTRKRTSPLTWIAEPIRLWTSLPLRTKLFVVCVIGAGEAAAVGYATSQNPAASPAHVAVTLRILTIGTLIGTGVYAQTNRIQARMGTLLIGFGLYAGFWTLNGSSNRLLFSVGVLCSALAPAIYAYLVLAHPTGRLHYWRERLFVWGCGGLAALLWIVGYLFSRQPPLKTALLLCAPHCPNNAFSLGSGVAGPEVRVPLLITWLALTCGAPILIHRRVLSSSGPVRRSMTPVLAASAAAAILLVLDLLLHAAGARAATAFGAAYIEVGVAVSLAILLGLNRERLFVGAALAEFVNRLTSTPAADPQALIATVMRDPSLTIAYRRPGTGTYVDSSGAPLREGLGDHAITWIEHNRLPVAAVIHDPALADQERFLQAAGTAALMQLEQTRLEADLRASVADLEASRIRLMEAANAERRRLERDLHDGVQQQLTALRIKLDMVGEQFKHDVAAGERMLASVGEQMDDTLQGLRLLARGIYPSVLNERGLVDALKSMVRSLPIPVAVRGTHAGRYHEDVEVAVYFCCLEAVQNVVKHAGPDADPAIHLWQDGPRLHFEVRDSGRGFEPTSASRGAGMTNMRDRVQAIGGTLTIASSPGHDTSVRGAVPVE